MRFAAAVPAVSKLRAQTQAIAPGPFRGTRESLKSYRVLEWFRDAKFGIWAHLGPQSEAEYGDLVRPQYVHRGQQAVQVSRPEVPPSFQGRNPDLEGREVDPTHLMSLYKKAGAKYFVSMGVHHDNFDLWIRS